MKQLLIVKEDAALNGGVTAPTNLTGMANGAIGFYELSAPSTWLAAAPTSDFAIVLGRGTNSNPIIIPEVDYNTVSVVKAEPQDGAAFSAEITIPTVSDGKTYTLVLVKKGAVPYERNTWTATETIQVGDNTTDAAAIARKLGATFQSMADNGSLPVSVVVASAKITITALNVGDQWTLKAGDALFGTSITETDAEPALGSKEDIQDLASRCAAGKGFTDTYNDGDSIYPGYPEEVEDGPYVVYTLRFAVGRKAAKTRDERVWQIVHIAVPEEATAASSIETIVGGIKAE